MNKKQTVNYTANKSQYDAGYADAKKGAAKSSDYWYLTGYVDYFYVTGLKNKQKTPKQHLFCGGVV